MICHVHPATVFLLEYISAQTPLLSSDIIFAPKISQNVQQNCSVT